MRPTTVSAVVIQMLALLAGQVRVRAADTAPDFRGSYQGSPREVAEQAWSRGAKVNLIAAPDMGAEKTCVFGVERNEFSAWCNNLGDSYGGDYECLTEARTVLLGARREYESELSLIHVEGDTTQSNLLDVIADPRLREVGVEVQFVLPPGSENLSRRSGFGNFNGRTMREFLDAMSSMDRNFVYSLTGPKTSRVLTVGTVDRPARTD